jgi:hypothetical protein
MGGTPQRSSPTRAATTRLALVMEGSTTSNHNNAVHKIAQSQTLFVPAMASNNQQDAPYYEPSLPPPSNPFTSVTPHQRFGFLSPTETLALNFSAETSNASPMIPLAGHTPQYTASYMRLGANENLFRDLKPVTGARRLHNIVGGWVASDGSETPEPERAEEGVGMELETGGAGGVGTGRLGGRKKRRGKRGGKNTRRKGVGRSAGDKWSVTTGGEGSGTHARTSRDYGAFEDTKEFLMVEEGIEGHGEEGDSSVNIYVSCMALLALTVTDLYRHSILRRRSSRPVNYEDSNY